MNPFSIIKYQLYLLQLENYELGRYFSLLIKKGIWPKKDQRKELVWSKKAEALFTMALGFHVLIIIAAFEVINNWFLFFVILPIPFYFLLYSLALLILWPLDNAAKKTIISKAKRKLAGLPGVKVIGIAGSYGKTTMKEVVGAVLSAKFSVLSTPDSVNTPVGIGRWILNKVDDETQIIILEMGEHYVGDIKEICEIAKPDIAVVTGINESHLERMKTLDSIVSTVFEIVSGTKPGARVVLNAQDENVNKNYKKFVWPDHKVEEYKVESIEHKVFSPEKLNWEAEIEGIGKVKVNLLGEYALGDVVAATILAKNLGMTPEEIKQGIAKIKTVGHRLQPIKSAGEVLVIDDSYNGNPAGTAEAIKVLSRFINRRKIYITPGLVEMGKSAPDIHREIGRELAGVADIVILIKNSVSGFIEEGIRNGELGVSQEKPQIIWFNSAPDAHEALKNILKPGDVILFQNDWGDQYV